MKKMRVGQLPWKNRPHTHYWSGKCCRYKKCGGCTSGKCPLSFNVPCGKDDFTSSLFHGDVIVRDYGYGYELADVFIVEFADFHGDKIIFVPVDQTDEQINDDDNVIGRAFEVKDHTRTFLNLDLIVNAFPNVATYFEYASSTPEETARSEKKRTWIKRTRDEIVEPLLKRARPALPRDVREIIADKVFN